MLATRNRLNFYFKTPLRRGFCYNKKMKKRTLFFLLAIILLASLAGFIVYQARPHFILNPSGRTPLSGVYKLPFTNKTPLTITVAGQRGDADITHTFPAGYGREFPIHGLYPKTQNQVTIHYQDQQQQFTVDIPEVTVNKGYVPAQQVVITDKDPSQAQTDDIYFISASIGEENPSFNWAILGYSRQGNLRYVNIDDKPRLNELQRIVPENNEMILITDIGSETLLGKRLLDLSSKNKAGHHDRVKKGDHFISLANSKWGIEDRVLEIDSKGKIVRDLSAGELIRKIVRQQNNPAELEQLNRVVFDEQNIYITKDKKKQAIDWAHINSIVYDEQNDILYCSFRNLGVIAVKYTPWELIWWMVTDDLDFLPADDPTAKHRAFLDSLPSLQPYRVKGDGLTDGPKHHHALFLWPDGTLGLFDNRGYAHNKSRYAEYQISGQPGQWTAKKVYEYFDPALTANDYTSDIDVLPNGNLLILYGMEQAVVEVDKKTQEKLYQLSFALPTDMIYRVDKMPFYPTPGRQYPKEHKF